MEKILLDSVQDDLNIALEEILLNEKPSKTSISQLQYDLERLEEYIEPLQDLDEAYDVKNLITTVEKVLKAYVKGEKATSPIRITRDTKRRLKNLEYTGKINEGYDEVIQFLLDFYERSKSE